GGADVLRPGVLVPAPAVEQIQDRVLFGQLVPRWCVHRNLVSAAVRLRFQFHRLDLAAGSVGFRHVEPYGWSGLVRREGFGVLSFGGALLRAARFALLCGRLGRHRRGQVNKSRQHETESTERKPDLHGWLPSEESRFRMCADEYSWDRNLSGR